MKHQVLLPGVELPRAPQTDAAPDAPAVDERGGEGAGQWPALHDMMGSLFVFESHRPKPVPITVLGLGVDSKAPLTPEAQHEIEAAQVVAGGRAQLDRLAPDWEDAPSGERQYLPIISPLTAVLDRLEEHYAAGRRVVVLADGDPLFFGIGGTLARRFAPQALRIFSGRSVLQEICSRLTMPWHAVRCVSLHGRDDWRAFNVAVSEGVPVCVLTDAASAPHTLARHLLDRGVEGFEAHVFERLGQEDERVRRLSLREAASQEDFTEPCTVLLLPDAPQTQGTENAPLRPSLGLPDAELAVEHGLITKSPVRAAALSLLRLAPRHTLWDVGSGSGAVALEACALAHEGCVVAVERSAVRALGIRENRRRFGAAILEVHTGNAPECFDRLPAPDRIFIGGGLSGDSGEDMLEAACHYLPPGGRVVASCVLMGTLHNALEFFRRKGWPVEFLSVQAAEGAPLADDLRLVPFNPVFLVAGQKPAIS